MQAKSRKITKKIISMILMIMMILSVCIPASAQAQEAAVAANVTEVAVGETTKLSVYGWNLIVTWTSSDEDVATVNGWGKVTGVSVGEVTISAKALSIFGITTTTEFTVSVTPVNADATIEVGETLEITVDGNETTTWTTSDEAIATVENGTVTGVGEGVATITATTTKRTGFFWFFFWGKKTTVVETFIIEVKKSESAEDPIDPEQYLTEDIAELFGVDPNEYDSDNDGLSNYIEVYFSETDPASEDTDEDGILDAEEDLDEDGITNITEIELGTRLDKEDTDGDGLSDYKEINETNTDPCKYDTDDDGLSDGDEIILGLDPLSKKTDGTTSDSEREFTQELDSDNIDEQLKSEDNEAVPSLDLTTSGNINNRVSIDPTESDDFSDSRAIVGEPIDIIGENLGEGTISFTLKNDASTLSLKDTGETFVTTIICKYNEDGSVDYFATEYDEEKNVISAAIDGAGTYFVLDVKNLFDELGLSLPTTSVSEASTASVYEAKKAASSNAMAQADIVFLIDTTGSMRDEINNVKNNVQYFVDALKEKGVSAGFALIDYQDIVFDGYNSTRVHKNGSSNWFYDVDAYKDAIDALYSGNGGGGDGPECAVDALETARLLDMRASAGKIFILVTDANYKVDNRYGIPSMDAEIELLKNAGITCAVVSSSSDKDTYYNLYNETNGVWANIYGDFYSELMALADKIGEDIVGDGYWIYLNGPVPVPVRLDEKPYEGSTVDTDKDGIPDIQELKSIEPDRYINLDDLIVRISKGIITGTNYGTVAMYEYISNPITEDTDFDGFTDKEDDMPRSNKNKGVLHHKYTNKECDIEFTMDYRDLINGDNTKYSKNLSVLSILYASDAYNKTYIEITDGAKKGGSDDGKNLGTLLGLESDSQYIKINASDYSVDKDDITDFFVGHKKIVYNGVENEVIVVSVRGTNGTSTEWSSNFDVGADADEYYDAVGREHPDWNNKANHKGLDVATNRVYTKLFEYIYDNVDMSAQKTILITGHSRGAGIANILGARFEKNHPEFKSFTYTFAAPYTTTEEDAESYETIFNVVNTDDLVTYLPIEEWGFEKYGTVKEISVDKYYEFDNPIEFLNKKTFEYLNDDDYNNCCGIERKVATIAKIIDESVDDKRAFLYTLDTTEDGKVYENNVGHISREGAEEELEELEGKLKKERLDKYCKLDVVGGGILWHVEVNYCPAYLMQTLANMAVDEDVEPKPGPALGRDVKGVYADAKWAFAKVYLGGIHDPHMPATYYLIAYNNVEPLK